MCNSICVSTMQVLQVSPGMVSKDPQTREQEVLRKGSGEVLSLKAKQEASGTVPGHNCGRFKSEAKRLRKWYMEGV